MHRIKSDPNSNHMKAADNKTAYIPPAWETVPCPFCGSDEYKIYERFGSDLQYTYVRCKKCRLVYSSPRPKYDQLFIDAAYKDYYQYSDSLSLDDFTHVKESGVKMFQKELDNLLAFDHKRTAVLDIGSGMGTFLYAAKTHYPVCVGIDVSEKMAAFVRKALQVEVQVIPFEQFTYPVKFSLIHMSHVLEHVPNPIEWLQKAKSLLSEEGILVINVPHKWSLGSRLQHLFVRLGLKRQFSDAWNDASRTPDHLFEPVVPAMDYLLDSCGFEVLDHFTYSRRDPASNSSLSSRIFNRILKQGSNLSYITRAKNSNA